jgi:cytochrome P450
MDHNPDVKKKLLEEIIPVVEAAKENIVENLKYETVMDLEYLHLCFYESLRIDPPAVVSLSQTFTQDVVLKNGLEIKKDEVFFVFIEGIHHDPEQWQQPDKFLPERFDSHSPLYKKPNGEPRNSLAFTPFLGGKRGCTGKTFAEVIVRYTIPILYYHFDFELVLPEHKANKPKIHMASSQAPVVPVKLTYRNLA